MPLSLSSRKRLELGRLISGLLEAEFEQLRFALNLPAGILSSRLDAQGSRGIALLEWAEGPTGPGINDVLEILNEIAPGKFKIEAQSLLPIFQDHESALAGAIQTAYRLVNRQSSDMPETLADKLDKLGDSKPGNSLFEAIDRFAALLSLPDLNPEPDVREALKVWLKTRVSDFDAVIADVKPLLQQHLEQQEKGVTSHLLIYVQEEVEGGRLVAAYLIQDDSQYDIQSWKGIDKLDAPEAKPFLDRVTRESLPSLVKACINEASLKPCKNLILHLVLPLSWLNETCDRWSFMNPQQFSFLPDATNRIGVRYCCTVRIAERLIPEILRTYQEPWQRKWSKLLKTAPEELRKSFVQGDKLSLETELVERLNRPTSLGLKTSQVYQDSQYEKLFGTLIATGTPVAVWLRNDQFDETVCTATALDNVLACRIATLPEAVKQCRSAAIAADETAHIGHHLSFLWEDPKLIPPPKSQLKIDRS